MLSAIHDLEINKVIEKINKIYDNGISQIYFQAILKKQGENEYELHWRISLMNHITILMNKLLMKQNKI